MNSIAVYPRSSIYFSKPRFAFGAHTPAASIGDSFEIKVLPASVDQGFQAARHNEAEPCYIVRPAGGPADGSCDVTVRITEISPDEICFAADRPLSRDTRYTIIAVESHDPLAPWADLHVCFRVGSLVMTEKGLRPVELVRRGDRVQTADDGLQEVIWSGVSFVGASGAAAPVRFGAQALEVLGDPHQSRPLFVSPHHNMQVTSPHMGEVIVPAKSLIGWLDITAQPVQQVGYCHLLLEKHQLLHVGGIWSESFNPGPVALQNLSAAHRKSVLALCPEAAHGPAFCLVRPRHSTPQWRRADRQNSFMQSA